MDFEKLEIYRIAENLGDEIWVLVSGWRYFEKDTIGKQITRSADSIAANIAEGAGRGSYKDNKRFARMARSSLNETRHWLRRAYCRKLINHDQVNKIKPFIEELGPRLNAYIASIGKKNK